MSMLMKLKNLPMESAIVGINITLVSLYGLKIGYNNIKKMREENHFEEIKDPVLVTEPLKERGHQYAKGEIKSIL